MGSRGGVEVATAAISRAAAISRPPRAAAAAAASILQRHATSATRSPETYFRAELPYKRANSTPEGRGERLGRTASWVIHRGHVSYPNEERVDMAPDRRGKHTPSSPLSAHGGETRTWQKGAPSSPLSHLANGSTRPDARTAVPSSPITAHDMPPPPPLSAPAGTAGGAGATIGCCAIQGPAAGAGAPSEGGGASPGIAPCSGGARAAVRNVIAPCSGARRFETTTARGALQACILAPLTWNASGRC